MNNLVTGVTSDKEQAVKSAPFVLVVDDHPAVCDMLCQALELAGYQASHCGRREVWLNYNTQPDNPPALVILDLSYPPVQARTFLRCLRELWPAPLPIIAMTTSQERAHLPVECVFSKPFHISDLLAEVQRLLPLSQ